MIPSWIQQSSPYGAKRNWWSHGSLTWYWHTVGVWTVQFHAFFQPFQSLAIPGAVCTMIRTMRSVFRKIHGMAVMLCGKVRTLDTTRTTTISRPAPFVPSTGFSTPPSASALCKKRALCAEMAFWRKANNATAVTILLVASKRTNAALPSAHSSREHFVRQGFLNHQWNELLILDTPNAAPMSAAFWKPANFAKRRTMTRAVRLPFAGKLPV